MATSTKEVAADGATVAPAAAMATAAAPAETATQQRRGLLGFSDDALTLVAAYTLPAALSSLPQTCRRFRCLFGSRTHGAALWSVALRSRFGFAFLSRVDRGDARHELRRLSAVARAARDGRRWRFHGFERESANVRDAKVAASEFEWKLELDRDGDDASGAYTATIWWFKLRSRHGNSRGMNSWQPEKLAVDAFADGVLTCHGVECGAGLSCGKYAFELGDGGLSVIERGSHMRSGSWSTVGGHQQYMVGLAQDEHIADPVGYVCDLHFPGQPPGLSLGEFLAHIRGTDTVDEH